MKNFILSLSIIAVLLTLNSCCEYHHDIILTPTAAPLKDSIYTAAIETPQQRNVLLEEFTGLKCANCPTGHQAIADLQSANPDHFISIGYHVYDFQQSEPTPESHYDLRTLSGTAIEAFFGAVPGMPIGVIDRIEGNTVPKFYKSVATWQNIVASRLAVPTVCNLKLSSTLYNDSVVVTVQNAFTQAYNKKITLTVAIIENNIIDAQENAVPNLHIDTNYVHQHVFREMITTPASGKSVLDTFSTIPAGLVHISQFGYKLKNILVPANCKIVAFINAPSSTGDGILQAAEINLK